MSGYICPVIMKITPQRLVLFATFILVHSQFDHQEYIQNFMLSDSTCFEKLPKNGSYDCGSVELNACSCITNKILLCGCKSRCMDIMDPVCSPEIQEYDCKGINGSKTCNNSNETPCTVQPSKRLTGPGGVLSNEMSSTKYVTCHTVIPESINRPEPSATQAMPSEAPTANTSDKPTVMLPENKTLVIVSSVAVIIAVTVGIVAITFVIRSKMKKNLQQRLSQSHIQSPEGLCMDELASHQHTINCQPQSIPADIDAPDIYMTMNH